MNAPLVAISPRLRGFPQITTLGVRANLEDYSPSEMDLIRRAPKIYYPTNLLAEQLSAIGKPIFPSLACHLLECDKVKQTRLFGQLGLPHPRTRMFFGRQRSRIEDFFAYPMIAKKARGSSLGRGVWLLEGPDDLRAYLAENNPAYIQEYVPATGDIRVVVINYRTVCAYRRLMPEGEFRSNLAQGGIVSFEGVPPEAVALAEKAARLAGLDDVGVDVIMGREGPLLLELNMKYGHQGPRAMGLDIVEYIAGLIIGGRL